MFSIAQYAVLIVVLIVSTQLYFHATSYEAERKQEKCRKLGIFLMTVGIVCLVFRDLFYAMAGFVFIMLGFRLIAYSLDRIVKQPFIDPDKAEFESHIGDQSCPQLSSCPESARSLLESCSTCATADAPTTTTDGAFEILSAQFAKH